MPIINQYDLTLLLFASRDPSHLSSRLGFIVWCQTLGHWLTDSREHTKNRLKCDLFGGIRTSNYFLRERDADVNCCMFELQTNSLSLLLWLDVPMISPALIARSRKTSCLARLTVEKKITKEEKSSVSSSLFSLNWTCNVDENGNDAEAAQLKTKMKKTRQVVQGAWQAHGIDSNLLTSDRSVCSQGR